jgi:hypothetical protein
MNSDQITGLLRILVPMILLFFKKDLTPDVVSQFTDTLVNIVLGLVTLGSLAWTIFAHSTTQKIKSTAAINGVAVVVAPQELKSLAKTNVSVVNVDDMAKLDSALRA